MSTPSPAEIASRLSEAQTETGNLDAAFSAILTRHRIEIDGYTADMLQRHRLRAAKAFAAVRAIIKEGKDA